VFKVLANIEVWHDLYVSRLASSELRAFRPSVGSDQGRSGNHVVSRIAARERGPENRPHYVLLVTEGGEPGLHHGLWLHLTTRCGAALEELVSMETLEDAALALESLRGECEEADRRIVAAEASVPPARSNRPLLHAAGAAALGALLAVAASSSLGRAPEPRAAEAGSNLALFQTVAREWPNLEGRVVGLEEGVREYERILGALAQRIDEDQELSRASKAGASRASSHGWSLGLPLYPGDGDELRVPFSLPVVVDPSVRALRVSARLPKESEMDLRIEELAAFQEGGRKRIRNVREQEERDWLLTLPEMERETRYVLEGKLEVAGCLGEVSWASLWVEPVRE
jgi:hypothetical protein